MIKIFITNFINQYGPTILYTIITTIISSLGILIKKIIIDIHTERTKKETVEVVCKGVEQLYKNLSGEEKLQKTISNVTEILEDKNIYTNDLELRMLIESTIHSINDK